MTSARFQLRAALGLGVLVVALLALLVRLAAIQLRDCEKHALTAERQHRLVREDVHAPRGALTDRRGRLLAKNVYRASVGVDPKYVAGKPGEREKIVRILRDVLDCDASEQLDDRWRRSTRTGKRTERQFAYVQRKIKDHSKVTELRRRLSEESVRGVSIVHEPVRVYPCGSLAAQTIGFTLEEQDGPRGVAGAERLADGRLRGKRGSLQTRRDVRRRTVRLGDHETEPAVPGEDVRLTIDAVLQQDIERLADAIVAEHGPHSVVAAVLDVRNGELLAVTSRPTFDPNDIAQSDIAAQKSAFFTDTYALGSVFKPIAMTIALDADAVRPGETIDCTGGRLELSTRTIREDKHKDLGRLTPAGVIALSSNVGMAQIALRTGIEQMRAGVKRFGFGRKTGARWPGESAGLMTADRKWSEVYTLCSVAFGQEISVTPVQMLMAYGAIANGGLLHRPRLFADAPPMPPVRVASPRAIRDIVPMMEAVLTEGTARRIDTRGYRVAGKTGTAEVLRKGEGVVGHIASFACFGPVSEPRFAVLVLADRPTGKKHYGGDIAAPAAMEALHIALRRYDVAPDKPRELRAGDAAPAYFHANPSREVQHR